MLLYVKGYELELDVKGYELDVKDMNKYIRN